MRCGAGLFGSELQQQRAAAVVEPQFGAAHGVPRRLLTGHEQEQDRGSGAARTGVVRRQRGLGNRQPAAPGFPEPAALGMRGQVEPIAPNPEVRSSHYRPYSCRRSTLETMSNVTAPIVLIHGLWMSADSWRGWIDRYGPRATSCMRPRGRADQTAGIGLGEVVDHYDAFVRALPDPPILMGHSSGGLITQMLLDRGLGRAGVAIHPVAAARGATGSAVGVEVHLSGASRAVEPAPCGADSPGREFHYVFANTVSRRRIRLLALQAGDPGAGRRCSSRARRLHCRSRRRRRSSTSPSSDRAPLLLIAGDRDHIDAVVGGVRELQPLPAVGRADGLQGVPGRPHLTAALDGWSDVADYALTWTAGRTRRIVSSHGSPAPRLAGRAVRGDPGGQRLAAVADHAVRTAAGRANAIGGIVGNIWSLPPRFGVGQLIALLASTLIVAGAMAARGLSAGWHRLRRWPFRCCWWC